MSYAFEILLDDDIRIVEIVSEREARYGAAGIENGCEVCDCV